MNGQEIWQYAGSAAVSRKYGSIQGQKKNGNISGAGRKHRANISWVRKSMMLGGGERPKETGCVKGGNTVWVG